MENIKESIQLSGTAWLLIRNGARGEVLFYVTGNDRSRSIHGKIRGDSELLSSAWRAKKATLLLNKKFTVQVLGRDASDGGLLVDGRPLFRAFASRLDPANYQIEQKI